MIKQTAIALAERFVPKLLWRYRIWRWKVDTGEDEQQLLPCLCQRNKLSIDVGAAAGAYVAHLLMRSSRVVAFEPRPDAAEALRLRFQNTGLVSVEEVALSDSCGTVVMHVPAGRPMLSTIEASNRLEGASDLTPIEVARKQLDDYAFSPVGFLKIDVEGHEQAVLDGSKNTLARERPLVLIEVEERHRPDSIRSVLSFFDKLKYEGFFLLDGRLRSTREFVVGEHQNLEHLDSRSRRIGTYVNNFLFFPMESMAALRKSGRLTF